MTLVTCLKCGTVHMGVSRAYAEKEVADFNAYFATLTPDVQQMFGGHESSVSNYEGCWCGGNVMRPAKDGDCPEGVTIGPVIWEASEP